MSFVYRPLCEPPSLKQLSYSHYLECDQKSQLQTSARRVPEQSEPWDQNWPSSGIATAYLYNSCVPFTTQKNTRKNYEGIEPVFLMSDSEYQLYNMKKKFRAAIGLYSTTTEIGIRNIHRVSDVVTTYASTNSHRKMSNKHLDLQSENISSASFPQNSIKVTNPHSKAKFLEDGECNLVSNEHLDLQSENKYQRNLLSFPQNNINVNSHSKAKFIEDGESDLSIPAEFYSGRDRLAHNIDMVSFRADSVRFGDRHTDSLNIRDSVEETAKNKRGSQPETSYFKDSSQHYHFNSPQYETSQIQQEPYFGST